MSTAGNKNKGDTFEKLVKLIIESVLESDPKFKGQKFTVEMKVRDTTSGVPNEIDVLAVSSPNTDYESKFIYECKNWKRPVGKDVVQLLAKKVDDVRATRGFLVAKSITKHAKKQINAEPRLRYIRCAEDFLSPLCSMELLHTDHEVLPPSITVKWRTFSSGDTSMRLEPKKITCLLNGKPADFLNFVNSQIDEIAERARK